MPKVKELHDAVKNGDLAGIKMLLDEDRGLANAVSTTDARATYPLHVAAEFGQAEEHATPPEVWGERLAPRRRE